MSAVLEERQELPSVLSINLNVEDVRPKINDGQNALVEANAIVVDSPEMAQFVSNQRTELAKQIDHIKQVRADFIDPAKKIIERASSLFDAPIAVLERARTLLGDRLVEWQKIEDKRIADEKAKAEAEARRLRQEAEAKAAAERARAEQEAAEKRRQAAEAEERRRKLEAEGNAKAAASAAAEAARKEQEAAAAIERGEAKAEQAIVTAAASAPVPVAAPVQIAGTTFKDNWTAELKQGVTEEAAKQMIVAAAAQQPQLLGVIDINMSALNKLAKALKGAMNVPGYAAVNNQTAAGKRK